MVLFLVLQINILTMMSLGVDVLCLFHLKFTELACVHEYFLIKF